MLKRIKINPNDSKADIKQEILSTYTLDEILELLIDYTIQDNANTMAPIVITQEQFLKHFRLVGQRAVQQPTAQENHFEQLLTTMILETRGRKKGSKMIDGKLVMPEDLPEEVRPNKDNDENSTLKGF